MTGLLLALAIWWVAAVVFAAFTAATMHTANERDRLLPPEYCAHGVRMLTPDGRLAPCESCRRLWPDPQSPVFPDPVGDPDSPTCWRCHHATDRSGCGCCADEHSIPAATTASPPRR